MRSPVEPVEPHPPTPSSRRTPGISEPLTVIPADAGISEPEHTGRAPCATPRPGDADLPAKLLTVIPADAGISEPLTVIPADAGISEALTVIPADAGISEPLNTRVETHPLVELVEAHSAGLAVGEIPAFAGMTSRRRIDESFAGISEPLTVIPADAGISEPLNTRVETHPLVELVEAHSAGLAVGEIPAFAGMTSRPSE